MIEPADQPAKPLRPWRPMAAWTAGIVLALGLAWVVAAVVVPVWQVRAAVRRTYGVPAWNGYPQAAMEKEVRSLGSPERAAERTRWLLFWTMTTLAPCSRQRRRELLSTTRISRLGNCR